MPDSIANNICLANNSCADRHRIFAYRALVATKKNITKQAKYAKAGAIIKAARIRSEYTQAEAGAKLGITRQGFAHYENGHSLPTSTELPKLCEILGIKLGQLFPKGAPPLAIPPNDSYSSLDYLHAIWDVLDERDRKFIIESAEGRATRKGLSLDDLRREKNGGQGLSTTVR